ncbi:prepilin-type N-terminal cleavage/methylation domain-containing protein [Candidatus Sumerlaeota bacterium]|nr:prepilin-type N-terminal cleavage/methylation domain-containing protein [Candidatus Sumerlaeota bacterium]
MHSRPLRPPAPRRRGLTLIEVVVALAIFLFGVVALLNLFPLKVRTGADATVLTEAVLLAQLKAQEIRRDNAPDSIFFLWLRSLVSPTPPEGIPFAENPRLRYAFSGRSVLDPVDDPGVPEDDYGVPRIIVLSPTDSRFSHGVVWELRFED